MATSMNGYQGMKGGPTGGNIIPKGYEQGQIQQFTPEQMQLFQQMFGQVGPESYTSRLAGGDQNLFDQMEQPALKQFSALQGNIASRFSGMGSGARRSSGFQNTMGQAGMDFASQLQSNRQSLQRQAIQDLMGMSSDLLGQKPTEQFLAPKQKPWWQEFLTGIAGNAGQLAKSGAQMYMGA